MKGVSPLFLSLCAQATVFYVYSGSILYYLSLSGEVFRVKLKNSGLTPTLTHPDPYTAPRPLAWNNTDIGNKNTKTSDTLNQWQYT